MRSVFGDLLRHLQRNMLAGLITIGPLFVTWLVFSFVVGSLANAGLPIVRLLGNAIPGDWIEQPWLQSILAVLLTLVVLYAVGRITSLVVGRQAFNLFEAALERLPVVAKVDHISARSEQKQGVWLALRAGGNVIHAMRARYVPILIGNRRDCHRRRRIALRSSSPH